MITAADDARSAVGGVNLATACSRLLPPTTSLQELVFSAYHVDPVLVRHGDMCLAGITQGKIVVR